MLFKDYLQYRELHLHEQIHWDTSDRSFQVVEKVVILVYIVLQIQCVKQL